MAVYVTKKCPHCGYKYQIYQSGDQRKYGCPYLTCEKCKNSFWDTDIKEPALYGYNNIHETMQKTKTIISMVVVGALGIGSLFFSLIMPDYIIIWVLTLCGCVWGIVSQIKRGIYNINHQDEIIAQQLADYNASIDRLKNDAYLKALAKQDSLAKKLLQQRLNGEKENYALPPQSAVKKDVIDSMPKAEKYDYSYLIIEDYINGKYDDFIGEEAEKMATHTCECLYLCSAWCIFHADKSKKEQVEFLRQRLLQKIQSLGVGVERITTDYELFNKHMLIYKKEVIDPEYKKDSSKDSYEKLLSAFVAEVTKVMNIEYYSGMVASFKLCMRQNK